MKLHLVRHPRPALEHGLCYGASDVPAAEDDLMRVLAQLHAAGLPGALPVYSSPLQRCALLARRLRPHSLRLDPRLAEMDFGRWELRPWSDIARAEVDAWAADLPHHRPGGAENVLDVARRVAAFVEQLRQAGHPAVLLVCHAGTIRLLTHLACGMTPEQAALRAAQTPHRIAYGELSVLEA